MIVRYADPEDETLENEPDWSKWQNAPLHHQPKTDFGQVTPSANISDGEEDSKDLDESKEDGDAVCEDKQTAKSTDKSVVVIDDLGEHDRDQEIKDLEQQLMMMDKIENEAF